MSDLTEASGFDRSYEWKVVILLGLAFGLVGLDRWILAPLFPAMMADLKLSYADLGSLVGVLALTWGVCAVVFGRVSDRIGYRRVLIPALIFFSLLSGATGIAGGMAMLLVVRGAMGAAEGAYLPASVAATAEASHPSRRGLNTGLQLSSFALLGFGIAPIIATQLLAVVPSWREVFMLVGVPGLILAYLIHRVLRDSPRIKDSAAVPTPWRGVLRARNVWVGTTALFCAMSCIFVMGAMVPSYLIDHLHIDQLTMGLIMSAMGWGGFLGDFAVPGVSDLLGRRWTACLAFTGGLAALWFFASAPAVPMILFLWLSLMSFFGIGLLALMTGPVATEAVEPGLTSSAVGMVSGLGEIFGGGIAPVIAGFVAQNYGIQNVFWVPIVGLALGIFVSLALRETAPRLARAPEPV